MGLSPCRTDSRLHRQTPSMSVMGMLRQLWSIYRYQPVNFSQQYQPQMSKPTTRFGVPAAITFLFFCAAVAAVSAIRLAGDLNGRVGFVVFLLVMLTPVFIATGMAVSVWRLTLRL